jgi:hypothetical protein
MSAVKLTTKAQLLDRLRDLLAMELGAEKNYEADVGTFTNFVITDTIEKIRQDELRHITLIKEAIALVEDKPPKAPDQVRKRRPALKDPTPDW